MARAHRTLVALAAITLALPFGALPADAQAPISVAPPSATRLGTPSTPPDARGRTVLAAADRATGMKILVSTEDRWLWLVSGRDTLMSVPVAIGMAKEFEFEGRRFWFETPRSQRKVLAKQPDPRWNVPEWHYMERAKARGFELVRMTKDSKHLLDDGSFLLTIGDNVGRLNEFGNFWAFPPGMEIMFDGKVFVPPFGTQQRAVPDALGPYKLDTGDGYLIHGTNIFNEESIGEAVSHGCVRMSNDDLEKLYPLVPVGTNVFIF
ncbi:MAG: L,D-transpeptidase family protein [Gemmatimonadetes bacterium]|nr:L,D-transpeptidase family protein [Gemmatimonadota bacterium]